MCEIQSILSIIQILVTFFVGLIGAIISYKYNKYQKEKKELQYKPYLIITNLINNDIDKKNHIDKKNKNSKRKGKEDDFKNLNLPYIHYEKIYNFDENLFKKLISKSNDLKNNRTKSGSVYHIMYKNYRHLVMNFLYNEEDIIFDSAPTIIIIKNIGFDLCRYLIRKIKIFYKDGAKKTLLSNDEWQSEYVPSQQNFYLILSMATNNNLFSLCDVSGLKDEAFILQNKRVDLLKIDLSKNFLNYNKMEIYFIAQSSLSKVYFYKIIIEVIGDRLCASTEEILDKKSQKKLTKGTL